MPEACGLKLEVTESAGDKPICAYQRTKTGRRLVFWLAAVVFISNIDRGNSLSSIAIAPGVSALI